MKLQTYENIWFRRVPETWESAEGWRTSIAQSVLNDGMITIALFLLSDGYVVFVPMKEIRPILVNAPRPERHKGAVVGPFNVNPHSKTVHGVKVTMEAFPPKEQHDLTIYDDV